MCARQAERQAAESQAADLTAELESAHKQAQTAADEAAAALEVAQQKAAADLRRAQACSACMSACSVLLLDFDAFTAGVPEQLVVAPCNPGPMWPALQDIYSGSVGLLKA